MRRLHRASGQDRNRTNPWGSAGDAYDNALVETLNGLTRLGVIDEQSIIETIAVSLQNLAGPGRKVVHRVQKVSATPIDSAHGQLDAVLRVQFVHDPAYVIFDRPLR